MKYLGPFFEKYSSLVSLVLTIVGLVVFKVGNEEYRVYFISFVFLSLITLYYIIEGSRYKGYYKAFRRFNSGFADIHSISNVDIDNHKESAGDRNLIKSFLSSVQKAFEEITQSRISVCIKVIIFDEQKKKYFLHTFLRDGNSEHREALDREDMNNGVIHWLDSNTSFNTLFSVDKDETTLALVKPYFIKRFMPWSSSYKNSRVDHTLDSMKNHLIQFILEKKFLRRIYLLLAWPVDYRSSIVVPIIPYKVEKFGEAVYDLDRKSKVIPKGLLCIDSNYSSALRLRDVELMRGLADGIYNDLKNVLK